MLINVPVTGGSSTTPYGKPIHFVDGPPWDGTGAFESTTSFGDTNTTGTPLWHIRGRVVKVGTLEIYLIDPKNGIRGPFTATKVDDPWPYLDNPSSAGPSSAPSANRATTTPKT